MQNGKINLKTSNSPTHTENNLDGEPIEFEWNIFPGLTTWAILQKIQEHLDVRSRNREQFEDRIIFMSTFNDTDWTQIGNSVECFRIPKNQELRQQVSARTLVIPWRRRRRNMVWNAHLHTRRTVEYNSGCHVGKFQRQWTSDIPRYQCVESRSLEMERWRRCSIRFTAESPKAELLFQGGMMKQWETRLRTCLQKILKNWRKRFHSRMFVNLRDS